MSDKQTVQDEGGGWKYFSPMLHMDDDDLDPYQYRLLGHYRRVCGANGGKCTESVRTTATTTQMSVGQVSEVRKQLVDLKRISLQVSQRGSTITLLDCWRENVLRYTQPSPDEQQECSLHEHSVHYMNDNACYRSPHETKNNSKQPVNKDSTPPASGDVGSDAMDEQPIIEDSVAVVPVDGLPDEAVARAKAQLQRHEDETAQPKKTTKAKPVYDMVAVCSFGIPAGVKIDQTSGARIGMIASWLYKAQGLQETTDDALKVSAFYEWYDKENDGAARPKDRTKFAEQWVKWQANGNGSATPARPIDTNADIEFADPATLVQDTLDELGKS